jgi:hypothetical protein
MSQQPSSREKEGAPEVGGADRRGGKTGTGGIARPARRAIRAEAAETIARLASERRDADYHRRGGLTELHTS